MGKGFTQRELAMNMYTNEEYLKNNPTWGLEDARFKADKISRMLKKHRLTPKSVVDVGCGAGGVLSELHAILPEDTYFYGYDISPHAIQFCQNIKKDRIEYGISDIASVNKNDFDLMLALDVFEHLEDYYAFLRELRGKGTYKIFHIPLEMCAQTVIRMKPLLGARKQVGHLHYFTKDIALTVLKETGYEIIDYLYTTDDFDIIFKSPRTFLAKLPRSLAFAIHKDLAVRILGGYSLLVLAK